MRWIGDVGRQRRNAEERSLICRWMNWRTVSAERTITFYMDSLHYCDGKIRKKSDKIRMSLRKNIKKPTDLGFSIMAVNCPSCGGSFDAFRSKICPFCGSEYKQENNDWVIYEMRNVKSKVMTRRVITGLIIAGIVVLSMLSLWLRMRSLL